MTHDAVVKSKENIDEKTRTTSYRSKNRKCTGAKTSNLASQRISWGFEGKSLCESRRVVPPTCFTRFPRAFSRTLAAIASPAPVNNFDLSISKPACTKAAVKSAPPMYSGGTVSIDHISGGISQAPQPLPESIADVGSSSCAVEDESSPISGLPMVSVEAELPLVLVPVALSAEEKSVNEAAASVFAAEVPDDRLRSTERSSSTPSAFCGVERLQVRSSINVMSFRVRSNGEHVLESDVKESES